MSIAHEIIPVQSLKAACSNCSLRELCLPVGLDMGEMAQLDVVIDQRQPIKRGEPLFRAGDPFKSLYAVRMGFFKTTVLSEDGREQVTGFHMAGDLIGLDALGDNRHACTALALEDCEVCELPYHQIEELAHKIPALTRHFYKLMSREIVRDQGVMMLLGNMRAEERLVAFLLNLSQRMTARGFSSTNFVLRMTREEIGSYLGMKLETVSRTFSRFQAEGWIAVQGKQIEIVDLPSIKQLVSGCTGLK
ncbi:fumarate/nitrate reduction transcriptional regulator Fnr [Chitinimonas sp.]|uniref:fumarate/nitrate reduction transcriptional regulator Fnr n=1 Tax=Chitinimonas sp. TaxID=1934313 RepID=UPI0035ADF965